MGESFLIALREGFEAALIVAIVLAFVRRSDHPEQRRWVWIGTAVAIVLAVAIGLVLHVTLDGLEGAARLRTFAGICIAAALLLTWMIFWMRAHARALKGDLEGKAAQALDAQSGIALAAVAFVAVLREGLETALFLISTTTGSGGVDVVFGTLLGLAVAVALGFVVYRGSHAFDMRLFFQITGVLIILFAAGLVSRAIQFLQASGDLGSFNLNGVYDLRADRWLTQDTQSGRFLAGIFGWDPRPSIEQVVGYLAYLIPALIVFFRAPKPRRASGGSPPAARSSSSSRVPAT
ncbi:MAG: FTR1 family protein [Ilumatobacteraceae bacterium]